MRDSITLVAFVCLEGSGIYARSVEPADVVARFLFSAFADLALNCEPRPVSGLKASNRGP